MHGDLGSVAINDVFYVKIAAEISVSAILRLYKCFWCGPLGHAFAWEARRASRSCCAAIGLTKRIRQNPTLATLDLGLSNAANALQLCHISLNNCFLTVSAIYKKYIATVCCPLTHDEVDKRFMMGLKDHTALLYWETRQNWKIIAWPLRFTYGFFSFGNPWKKMP